MKERRCYIYEDSKSGKKDSSYIYPEKIFDSYALTILEQVEETLKLRIPEGEDGVLTLEEFSSLKKTIIDILADFSNKTTDASLLAIREAMLNFKKEYSKLD